ATKTLRRTFRDADIRLLLGVGCPRDACDPARRFHHGLTQARRSMGVASVTRRMEGDMAKPIPDGYHTVTPYIAVDGAADAIEYYKKAFGAKERHRMDGPDGTIAHAEIEIGDSLVMLSDPFPQSTVKPPNTLGGTSASIFLYVEDVDAVVKQAVDAGAKTEM